QKGEIQDPPGDGTQGHAWRVLVLPGRPGPQLVGDPVLRERLPARRPVRLRRPLRYGRRTQFRKPGRASATRGAGAMIQLITLKTPDGAQTGLMNNGQAYPSSRYT